MTVDVAAARERDRRKRLRRVAITLAPIALWMWWRIVTGNPVSPGLPDLPADVIFWLPGIALVLLLAVVFIAPMLGAGRSPHTIYLPEQIEVGFEDVKGLGSVLTEVRHTLDVFLNHARFRDEMGGSPRRGGPLRRPSRHRKDSHCQGDGQGGWRPLSLCVLNRVPVDVVRRDSSQDPNLLPSSAQGRPPRRRGHRLH